MLGLDPIICPEKLREFGSAGRDSHRFSTIFINSASTSFRLFRQCSWSLVVLALTFVNASATKRSALRADNLAQRLNRS